MLRLLLAALALILAPLAHAQDDAPPSGYQERGDTLVFVFDPGDYGLEAPARVWVTGAFRDWDDSTTSSAWDLVPDDDGIWRLALANLDYATIPPGTPFKFRVGDGVWLDAPADAPNQQASNLVFRYGFETPRLRAQMTPEGNVLVWPTGEGITRPLDASAYRIERWDGTPVDVAHVAPVTATETLLRPAERLDTRQVYYASLPGQNLRARVRFDRLWRTLVSDKPLGAIPTADETTFRVFAPRASGVTLYVYPTRTGPAYASVASMQPDADGVWEAVLPGDLHGMYYDFRVRGPAGPGSRFYEQTGQHATDPYALVSDDTFGRARVWRDSPPPRPVRGGRPSTGEIVSYQLHVDDFTRELPVDDRLKGTFTAVATPGLRNERGEAIGFDHLLELGINVVHLQPVQEYLHYPDSLWRAHFAADSFAVANQIDQENYQWGYRTTHFFALESRFRERGTEPGAEREQFKAMVERFHDAGIAVIVDIVPNHTGENMDGRDDALVFNAFDKLYYFRTDEDGGHIGPFGNEVKTEERPMVQRWLIDQAVHFVEELGVDGFRVDLAGQIDEQSLTAMMEALPDDAIVYGEPWIAPSDPDVVANPDWYWYKTDSPIIFFQDDARNAFKGPTSRPNDKATDRGFAGGNVAERPRVMDALVGAFPDEREPGRGINYLDIHDNWTLADQFATQDWNGLLGVDEAEYRIAAGLLFTSLGPVVVHGGSEFLRSKGAAQIEYITRTEVGNPIYFKGRGDTYNVRRPNLFLWDTLGRTSGPDNIAAMEAWWKGLIALRNSPAGEALRIAQTPPQDHVRWFAPDQAPGLLGYQIDERMLVAMNVTDAPARLDVDAAPGTWHLVADGTRAGTTPLDGPTLTGGEQTLSLPPLTLMIWVRADG
jgi:pullulanase/glycogen debranching enzyme